jgi:hypothetical protein
MKLLLVCTVGAGVWIGFRLYGECRVMQEQCGATVEVVLKSSILPVLAFLSISFIGLILVLAMKFNTRLFIRGATWLAASLMLGAISAEVVISCDEQDFEGRARQGRDSFSRARPWPFGNASLIYDPERGVYATD